MIVRLGVSILLLIFAKYNMEAGEDILWTR